MRYKCPILTTWFSAKTRRTEIFPVFLCSLREPVLMPVQSTMKTATSSSKYLAIIVVQKNTMSKTAMDIPIYSKYYCVNSRNKYIQRNHIVKSH